MLLVLLVNWVYKNSSNTKIITPLTYSLCNLKIHR